MPLFCFIHRQGDAVAHFEVLPEGNCAAVLRHAIALLNDRPDGQRAEIWDGDRLLQTIKAAR